MQAMNGSGGLTFPRVRSLLGCVVALLALSAVTLPSIASAKKASKVTGTYVALGDSLAFGFSEHQFNESLPTENPAAFEHGYPNEYLKLINEGFKQAQLVNFGCPGETSESLIGNNPTLLAAINAGLKGMISEP